MQEHCSSRQSRTIWVQASVILFSLIYIIFATAALAQETDYFGDINKDSDGSEEIVLETEEDAKARVKARVKDEQKKLQDIKERIRKLNQQTEEWGKELNGNAPAPTPQNIPAPKNMMVLQPVNLRVADGLTASIIPPTLRSPKLVHAQTFQSGASIPRGSKLVFDMSFTRPNDAQTSRKILLWSKLQNPEHSLPIETLYAIGIDPEEGDGFKWQKSNQTKWQTYAKITKEANFTAKNISGNLRKHTGSLQIETAVLKPGGYQFWVKLYRKENGTTIETDIQRFNFTVIDTPISLAADIPTSIPTYNTDRNVWAGEYQAFLSDWAVEPITAQISSAVPGFLVRDGDDIGETVFDFELRAAQKYIGRTERFTLKVTDGLGRTAALTRNVLITDSREREIKVNMPRSVNAGQTIKGTIMYPPGFTLKKKPRLGDERGFAWTNTNYTSFSIKIKEEGVDHKRFFGMVATGKINGSGEELVLSLKREYAVKSQDLIYDSAARARKKAQKTRDRKSAFRRFMIGEQDYTSNESTDAGSDVTSRSNENSGGDSDETGSANYELVYTEKGGEQSSGSIQTNAFQSSDAGDNTSSSDKICGYEIGGDYNISDVGSAKYFTLDGKKYLSWFIWKRGGTGPDLAFYKKDCVLAQEKFKRNGRWETFKFHPNGGKALAETSRYTKKWDYVGNLTSHAIRENGWNGKTKIICDNKQSQYAKCS